MMRYALVIAGIVMALGVGLGAFGAHALKSVLTPELLTTWQTAVQYHLVHGIALFAIALAAPLLNLSCLRWVFVGILLGLLLFSGSLYLWVLTGFYPLVFVTPIGGILWLTSWFGLAIGAWRFVRQQH